MLFAFHVQWTASGIAGETSSKIQCLYLLITTTGLNQGSFSFSWSCRLIQNLPTVRLYGQTTSSFEDEQKSNSDWNPSFSFIVESSFAQNLKVHLLPEKQTRSCRSSRFASFHCRRARRAIFLHYHHIAISESDGRKQQTLERRKHCCLIERKLDTY